MTSPTRKRSKLQVTILAGMLLIAASALLFAATRSWGKDEWLLTLLVVTIVGVYLGLENMDSIIK